MHVETLAQDGLIQIENVSYFDKAELANANTAEKEWTRQSLYAGPPFGNLDEELQILLERYLDERGIDAALASFVPDYIDYKEQKEYVRWLGSKLKPFIYIQTTYLSLRVGLTLVHCRSQDLRRSINKGAFFHRTHFQISMTPCPVVRHSITYPLYPCTIVVFLSRCINIWFQAARQWALGYYGKQPYVI